MHLGLARLTLLALLTLAPAVTLLLLGLLELWVLRALLLLLLLGLLELWVLLRLLGLWVLLRLLGLLRLARTSGLALRPAGAATVRVVAAVVGIVGEGGGRSQPATDDDQT